jgi:hypothetical protein
VAEFYIVWVEWESGARDALTDAERKRQDESSKLVVAALERLVKKI